MYYALLIGVCFTPKAKRWEWPPLKGCIHDVEGIKRLLTKSEPTAKTKILTASLNHPGDAHPAEEKKDLPTHSNIILNLNRIITQATAGDFVLIHFTGHGTAIQPNSPFSNGYTGELALVVLSSNDTADLHYLRGSEIADCLNRLVEKGVKVTVVLDCCAAGSVMRSEADPAVRFLPYSVDIDMASPPPSGHSPGLDTQTIIQVSRDSSMRSNWLVNPNGYTILAASGPNEEARELEIGGKWYGALSYFLIRAFARSGHVGGHHNLYSHLCARFKESWPSSFEPQTPMLYGNERLTFFGDSESVVSTASIPVIRTDHGLQLEAGQAQGICEGDLFTPCSIRPVERSVEHERYSVTFRVRNVRAMTSDLVTDSTAEISESGLSVTSLTRLSLRKFPIQLSLPIPCREAWDTALQQRESLDIYDHHSSRQLTKFAFSVAVLANSRYEIRDEENQLVSRLPVSPYDLTENANYVLDVLEHLSGFKLVKELNNSALTDPAYRFGQSFSIHILNGAGKAFKPGCLREGVFGSGCSHSECRLEVEDGDVIELVVHNKGRENDGALFIHVYDMGSCWEIENILCANHEVIPPRLANQSELYPTGTNGEWRKKLEMTVPSGLREKGDQECEDIIKVFLTNQPTSFTSLELPELGIPITTNKSSSGGSRQGYNCLSEKWAAFNFQIHTRAIHDSTGK